MISTDSFQKVDNIQAYLRYFFDFMGLSISARQMIDSERSCRAVTDEAYLHYLDKVKDFLAEEASREPVERNRRKLKPVSRDLFNTHMNYYIEIEGRKKECDFKDSLVFRDPGTSEIEKMVECLKAPQIDFDIIRHWMWLVKRSIFHPYAVKYTPYMLIFVSRMQGVGKSTFITDWIKPLVPFTMNASIDQITDSRVHLSMCSSYIVFLDEMAKLERTDINVLKRVLTMSQSLVRPLFDNHASDTLKKTSFIGASNRKIVESIYDPSGMRRFYEIELFENINWDLFSKIDFKKVWHSIDENLEHGYIAPVIYHLKAEQSNYIETEVFDDFFKFYDLNGGTEKKAIRSADLYVLYKKWCMENQYGTIDHKPFARKLMGMNVERRHKMDGSYYSINAASTIWPGKDAAVEIQKCWIR